MSSTYHIGKGSGHAHKPKLDINVLRYLKQDLQPDGLWFGVYVLVFPDQEV